MYSVSCLLLLSLFFSELLYRSRARVRIFIIIHHVCVHPQLSADKAFQTRFLSLRSWSSIIWRVRWSKRWEMKMSSAQPDDFDTPNPTVTIRKKNQQKCVYFLFLCFFFNFEYFTVLFYLFSIIGSALCSPFYLNLYLTIYASEYWIIRISASSVSSQSDPISIYIIPQQVEARRRRKWRMPKFSLCRVASFNWRSSQLKLHKNICTRRLTVCVIHHRQTGRKKEKISMCKSLWLMLRAIINTRKQKHQQQKETTQNT